MPKLQPVVVLGAVWAAMAVRVVRRRLRHCGVHTEAPRAPVILRRGGRGVRAALRHSSPTCLERALVEQAWLASAGTPRDVVIGVPPGGMRDSPAHAWVDGYDAVSPTIYVELHRLPPRPARRQLSFHSALTSDRGRG